MYPKILPYLERISTSSTFLGYNRLEGTVAPFSGTSRPAGDLTTIVQSSSNRGGLDNRCQVPLTAIVKSSSIRTGPSNQS